MKTSLYELTSDYQRLQDLASEMDTEEGEAAFADTLEGLQGEIGDKCENIAAVCRTLTTQAAVIKEEEERLSRRRKALESSADRLKMYMQINLEAVGLEKVKGKLFTVGIQKNPASLVIDDEALVPARFQKTEVVILRSEIKDALKAGEVVPGCRLDQSGKSLRIR